MKKPPLGGTNPFIACVFVDSWRCVQCGVCADIENEYDQLIGVRYEVSIVFCGSHGSC